jgi:hypothetical protein
LYENSNTVNNRQNAVLPVPLFEFPSLIPEIKFTTSAFHFYSVNEHGITEIGKCTVWNKLKFQRCHSCHITGDDISRATKGISNSTTV